MKNRNLEVIKDIIKTLRLQGEEITDDIDLSAIIEVKRNSYKIGSASSAATGTITVNLHATKKTYITGLYYSYSKDDVCDVTTNSVISYISTPYGTQSHWYPAMNTLEKQSESIFLDFSKNPLETIKGGTVTIGGAFTAGKLTRSVIVFGYEED